MSSHDTGSVDTHTAQPEVTGTVSESPPWKHTRVKTSVSPTITRQLEDVLQSQKPPTVREVQKLCKFYLSI